MVRQARFRHGHSLVREVRNAVTDWFQINEELRRIATRQIFFVGGAPRSGTTWLQQIIDQHPQASCRGEGLFAKEIFSLFDGVTAARRKSLAAKNAEIFSHTKGYPLPGDGDSRFLAASAILLALHQQADGRDCLAYGEKTPENVFAFPAFKQLFPRAKLITIVRDPRDLLTSAWHFFQGKNEKNTDDNTKFAFFRSAVSSINDGMRVTLNHQKVDPSSCWVVTYEQLHQNPVPHVEGIFRFLGLETTPALASNCLAATRFDRMTGGRQAGDGANGSFLRKGIVGDWRSTLSPAMNDLILQETGWAFPIFGWVP